MTPDAALLTGSLAAPSPTGAHHTREPQQGVLSLFRERAEAKVLFDASGVVAFASGATLLLLGLEAVTLGGTPVGQLPHCVGQPLDSIAHQAFLTRTVIERELAVTRPDGRTLALKLKASPMVEGDAVLGVGVTVRDSASPRVLACSVAGDLIAARDALRFSPFAVFFLDDRGNCFASNDRWTEYTGLTPEGSLEQRWLAATHPRGLEDFRRLAVHAHRDHDGWRTKLTAADGVTTFDAAAAPVFDHRQFVAGYVGYLLPVAPDDSVGAPPGTTAPPSTTAQPVIAAPPVTERQSSASGSEPGTDRVTGLPNRLLFARHLGTTLDRMKSEGLTVAVSLIDLAGIRAQRARSGNRVAEDSLFLLAKRLESTIRNIETAGALSPDTLGVLSVNWLFAEDLPIVARRLLGRMEEPLAGRDGEFVVEMCLGMSVARAGDTVETLFARAEQALIEAAPSPERYFIEGM